MSPDSGTRAVHLLRMTRRERRSLSFTADNCTGYRVWRESVSELLLVLCLCMTGERPEKQREAFTVPAQLLSPSVLQYHADLSGKSKGWAWNGGLFRISSRFLFHNGFKLQEIKGSKREMKGEGKTEQPVHKTAGREEGKRRVTDRSSHGKTGQRNPEN